MWLAYLDRGRQRVLMMGLVLVVAGWFTGSTRYGTAARTTLAGGLEGIGSRLGEAGLGGAGRWTATNTTMLRGGAVVLPRGGSCSGATTSRRNGCGGPLRRCCSRSTPRASTVPATGIARAIQQALRPRNGVGNLDTNTRSEPLRAVDSWDRQKRPLTHVLAGEGPFPWRSPDGIRTRATALRGRRARPLHNGARCGVSREMELYRRRGASSKPCSALGYQDSNLD